MTENATKLLHILVLGHGDSGDVLTPLLKDHAEFRQVDSLEDALHALRAEPYDLVITQVADFEPFQGARLSGEAAAILEGVTQGVGIVGKTGELEWANPKLLSMPAEVRQRVCRCCAETFAWAEAEARSGSTQLRGRRFSFAARNDEQFELTATPVIDLHHRITQVAAVVWDAAHARRLQEKLDAIDRAGRELLSLDADQFSRLDTQGRLALLERMILRCTKELLHFDNFEIRILNKQSKQLELVLAHGMPAAVLDNDIFATNEGNGIRGFVAARGRSYICPDVTKDARYMPGIDHAQSSLTVPLFLHDQVIGVANFESTKLAAFNEHDRQFAEIFSRYIALALHVLELLVSERQTTTGQLGSNMMAEITSPLNDILTDAESLVEDYIGHDDLRHRLRALSEKAVRIRETIKELTSAKPGLIGTRSAATTCKDPVLTGKKILVADDEDVIRETVRDVLIGYGCEVCAAIDGAVAIALFAEHRFDLVLSDIRMPRKNGYEVFAAAKEANPATPVILTTGFGYDPNHSIVRARREGLAAVLFKPFKVEQLLDEIRMALKSVKPGS